MNRRLLSIAVSGMALLGLGACTSGRSEPEVAFTVPGKAFSTTVPSSSTSAPNFVCNPPTVTNPPADQKPVVDKKSGDAPAQLVTNDLKVGDGAEAKPGDKVKVEYAGVLYKDGSEFDSSWSRGAEPLDFTLGQGNVIKGWDQGVAGMKVGGRRELIIPADLAYGAQGSPPKIGPNETLVFVVDLLQVCTPEAAPASTSIPPGAPSTSDTVTSPAGSTPTAGNASTTSTAGA